MGKASSQSIIFSAIAIITLGAQASAIALSDSSVANRRQMLTSQTRGSMQLAQVNNCRRISRVGGAIVYNNSRGTGGGEVLEQGTRVQINPVNSSGDLIQIDAINDTPRAGFVDKRTLGACDSAAFPAPQADNCRRISKTGGTILYGNLSGTGGGEVLEQGTRVQINPTNSSSNLIQVDAVNGTPGAGFVDKRSLSACNAANAPLISPAPSATVRQVATTRTGCYRIRAEIDRAKNGLQVYSDPSDPNSYIDTLRAGQVVSVVNAENLFRGGHRWVRISSPVAGYISDRTIGTPDETVSNLAPAPCK